jgi:two-component system OmpR family sensor kinase/two-component system sensor histidine kinase BaeS
MKTLLRQLWVQLSLAFTAVTLAAFAVVGVISLVLFAPPTVRSNVENYLNQPGGMIGQLAAFYHRQQSWEGIVEAFEQDPFNPLADVLFILDTEGRVVYGNPDPADLDPLRREGHIPIIDNGVLVGYAGFSRGAAGVARLQEGALRGISQSLILVIAVGSVIGILVGIVVSRDLSAPLDRLAVAARAIGAGQLTQRVKVEGSQEVVALAQAFNDMAGKLEEAEKLRRNLVADVAHELRTPLSVLQGNLQAVLDDVYPLDKAEIARLYDQTRLLARLVEDLRLLSQADAGLLVQDPQPADMAHLVIEQVETFRPATSGKGIALIADIPAALPPVRIDAPRMSQVMHNLLDNALRYTPEGGTIAVRMQAEAGWLRLEVQDSGRGIPPEHLAYLFDRFYRVDGTRSRETGGTGLGLAIARSIVQAHGGAISAFSDGVPGHGSTFVVRLPLVAGAVLPAEAARGDSPGRDTSVEAATVLTAQPPLREGEGEQP